MRGDSAFGPQDENAQASSFDDFAGTEPTPETVVELRELTEHLLAKLENDGLRWVARRKLEGYANSEIAHEMRFSLRTVERKLMRIRTRWSQQVVE